MIIFALFLFGVFLINSVFAVGEVTYCAERTNGGAWCQNVPLTEANQNYRFTPTSCEATSYCRLGTCVNVQEGVCMENTPQKVCEEPVGGVAGGLWFNSQPAEIPQCTLGCCLIGEQAAFTTQTRCEQLSSLYGLESNYRTDIKSEAQCIASAFPKTKGACIYDEDLQKKCKFITKEECTTIETQKENVEFNQGFLCSAEEIGTICGPSEKTTIVDGRDEVFFVDTCGNVANIYDASRQNDRTYWDKIVAKSQSCGFASADGNANSPECGNCDYLSGSTGALYDRFRDIGGSPNFGDYICRSLDCKFETDLNGDGDSSDDGESGPFKHGESWCAQSAGASEIISTNGQIPRIPDSSKENLPGSRYFRLVCYNGDVTVESCADFRQEICIQSTIATNKGDFRTAACRVNQWQSCVGQTNKKDCENFDKRDCKWVVKDTATRIEELGGVLGIGSSEFMGEVTTYACLPKFAPGYDFYKEDGDAAAFCVQASETCTVKFEKGLPGAFGDIQERVGDVGKDYKCVENCECLGLVGKEQYTKDTLNNLALNNKWLNERNNMCLALGDCGVSANYIKDKGYYDIEDVASISEIKE